MTGKGRASVWRYGIFTIGLFLAACDQSDEITQTEPKIDPLETVRDQQAAPDPSEITGSTELAQATDETEPAEPAEPGEAAEPAEPSEPPAPVEPAQEQRTQAPAGTFTPDIEEPEDIWEGRLPTGDGRSILVPAVNLFPGAARVDPQIENPYSGDTDAITAGERHFAAYNCAGCHAPLGGGGMGPPLSDNEWIYGNEPAQIYLSIMHGRGNGMPSWASMLPRKTAWELVSYIETLNDIENYAAELGFEGGGRFQQPEEGDETQAPDATGTEEGE